MALFTILCKYDQKFEGESHIFVRWPYIQRLLNVTCYEKRTRIIDLSKYLTWCAVKIIYQTLLLDVDSTEEYVKWAQWSDAEDLINCAEELQLDGHEFSSLKRFLENPHLWSIKLHNIIVGIDTDVSKLYCSVSEDLAQFARQWKTREALSKFSKHSFFTQYLDDSMIPEGTLELFDNRLKRTSISYIPSGCLPLSDELCNFICHHWYRYEADGMIDDYSTSETILSLDKYLLVKASPRSLRLYVALFESNSGIKMIASVLDGYTPMHLVAAQGDISLYHWLCSKVTRSTSSQKQNQKNICTIADSGRGVLPVHVAAWTNNSLILAAIVSMTVVDVGALPRFICQTRCALEGMNVAHYAAVGFIMAHNQCADLGNYSAFEWLVDNQCVDLDALDNRGRTVMDISIESACDPLLSFVTKGIEKNESMPGTAKIRECDIMDNEISYYESQEEDDDDDDLSPLSDDEEICKEENIGY